MSRFASPSLPVGMALVTAVYVGLLGISALGYWFLHKFWGDRMLVSFSDLLHPPGESLWGGVFSVWGIYVWAFAATLALCIIQRNVPATDSPGSHLVMGTWVSFHAGFFEELIYRAFSFMSAMVLLNLFNFMTFGIVGWVNIHVLVPVANFVTFGALEPQLMNANWVFGAAILVAAAGFRDAHGDDDSLSKIPIRINAWFMGMILFWVVFNYGLWAAVAAHIIYDLICYAVSTVSYAWRPREYALAARLNRMLRTSWR